MKDQPMDSFSGVNDYIRIIRELIRQEVSNQNSNFWKSSPGVVSSTPTAPGGYCSVKLYNDSNSIITNVKIKNGTTLVFGDNVQVIYINNSASNFYVDKI
jgi:hypothetical protein